MKKLLGYTMDLTKLYGSALIALVFYGLIAGLVSRSLDIGLLAAMYAFVHMFLGIPLYLIFEKHLKHNVFLIGLGGAGIGLSSIVVVSIFEDKPKMSIEGVVELAPLVLVVGLSGAACALLFHHTYKFLTSER